MLKRAYGTAIEFFEKYYWFFFAAACLTLAFYCFRCLDVQYVDSWDEARHGVNAYEMIQNGDYIRHTYNYEADDWNLKPSVSYWGIVLGFRLFGYGVFGLRFISALSYLLTGIGCGLFAKRYGKEASLLVMGFFCANTRPLSAHLARSGDADAPYLLFFTFAMLAMLRIRKNHKNLYACGLLFSLAFLTKSWHAGMIAVIGGLYLLLTRELFAIKAREWGWFLLSVFGPLLFWFGWRYTRDGFAFLDRMIKVDLLARTGGANYEGHEFPFSFYYDTVFGHEAYIYRWLLLICILGIGMGLFVMLRSRIWKRTVLEEGIGYLLWFFIPFLGFSCIRTKLIWYCYPCTVPLFLAAAIFLGYVLQVSIPAKQGDDELRLKSGGAEKGVSSLKNELFWAGKWMAAFLCIFMVGYYMRGAYFEVIRGAHGDGFQLFIQESAERDSSYAGRRAYIMVPTENPENLGTWDQNMLFLAEISGDFHCMDGGVEGYLTETEPAVLYLEQGQYEQYMERFAGTEVLYRNEEYILLGN